MNPRTEQLGVHIMMDGYGAPAAVLADRLRVLALLYELPKELGMHRICEPELVEVGPMNPRDPSELSGFVMIDGGHISFHTFPARGFVTIDLYACQNGIDRQWAINRLKSAFALADADVFIQERGLRYPVESREAA